MNYTTFHFNSNILMGKLMYVKISNKTKDENQCTISLIGVSRKSQKIGMHGVRISKVVATATVSYSNDTINVHRNSV